MAGPAYDWGRWRFEPTECRLTRDGEIVSLPAKTLDVLTALLRRAPRLVTKEEIFAAVWPDAEVEEGNIAFHVAALRKVLGEGETTSPIETVRGRGYRFVADVAIAQMPPTDTIQKPPAEPEPVPPAPIPAAVFRPRTGRRGVAIVATTLLMVAAAGLAGWRWFQAAPKAVVVLPFAAESDSARQRYINTMHSFIVAKLELQGFRVVPFSAGPPGEQWPDIGARLGVGIAIGGSLKELDRGWRVSMQAVRISDGLRIWNWRFDEISPRFAPMEAPDDERSQTLGRIGARVADGLKQRLDDRAN